MYIHFMDKLFIDKLFFLAAFFVLFVSCKEKDTLQPQTNDPEVCDGYDNNGNGLVDETFDLDNDFFFICSPVGAAIDCNDQDPKINPLAREVCDDNIDNDCDGKTDTDDPQCSSSCALASATCELNAGVCASVAPECIDDKIVCSYEKNQYYQPFEIFCSDKNDNDCDGKTDTDDSDCTQFGKCEQNEVDTPVCQKPNSPKDTNICTGNQMECYNGYWICNFASIIGFQPVELMLKAIDELCHDNPSIPKDDSDSDNPDSCEQCKTQYCSGKSLSECLTCWDPCDYQSNAALPPCSQDGCDKLGYYLCTSATGLYVQCTKKDNCLAYDTELPDNCENGKGCKYHDLNVKLDQLCSTEGTSCLADRGCTNSEGFVECLNQNKTCSECKAAYCDTCACDDQSSGKKIMLGSTTCNTSNQHKIECRCDDPSLSGSNFFKDLGTDTTCSATQPVCLSSADCESNEECDGGDCVPGNTGECSHDDTCTRNNWWIWYCEAKDSPKECGGPSECRYKTTQHSTFCDTHTCNCPGPDLP